MVFEKMIGWISLVLFTPDATWHAEVFAIAAYSGRTTQQRTEEKGCVRPDGGRS